MLFIVLHINHLQEQFVDLEVIVVGVIATTADYPTRLSLEHAIMVVGAIV